MQVLARLSEYVSSYVHRHHSLWWVCWYLWLSELRVCAQSGSVQQAVEASVTLNQWDQAVALAEKHNMLADIGRLLDKYASCLLEQGTSLEVVQLYRKAGRYLDAAKLMYQVFTATIVRFKFSQNQNILFSRFVQISFTIIYRNTKWHQYLNQFKTNFKTINKWIKLLIQFTAINK